MKKITQTVSGEYDGLKIPDFLKKALGLSVSLVKKVKFGGVFINQTNVHMRAIVHEGDLVTVELPDEKSENIRAIDMPLDIVYEDDYIIAVNKPSGMPTHPSRGNSLPTLAEGIMAYFSDENFVFRSVNRLDRDTGGIVIIAKDALSAAKLSEQMKKGDFVKKYLAVVEGIPSPAYATIDAPIERENESSIKRIVRDDGKRAITDYRIIKTLDDGSSLCEITLHTGRTHQIRVHMAYIGHPLKYDFLYGKREDGKIYMLHARSIEFTHPYTKQRLLLQKKADFE